MSNLAAIRDQRRSARLATLSHGAQQVLATHPGGQVWLYSCGEACGYGSLARGDWDACSDVNLLAIAPGQEQSEALADALRLDQP